MLASKQPDVKLADVKPGELKIVDTIPMPREKPAGAIQVASADQAHLARPHVEVEVSGRAQIVVGTFRREGDIDGGAYTGLAPRECVRIKKAGPGDHYVHGGLSLQECSWPASPLR